MDNPLVRIEPGLFIWTIITFLVLLAVLAKFVWKPLIEALNRREEKIRKSLEDAEKAQERMEKIQKEAEEVMTKARHEAQAILEDGKVIAQKVKDEIVADAKEKAESQVQNAKIQIDAEKEKAIEEIKGDVIDISLQVAEKLIKRNISKEDNYELIQDSLKKVGTEGEGRAES
jgi:F-type H+-transporting ATPase subunit b